jgi:EAL domain-containing protein (putative c-di-GMP-specific phosphodiesterase class I)
VTTTLDDFGTGYSSITYLREIPLDGIKVDRSFIRDMENGSPSDKNRNTSLVKAMAALAKNLDLNLVAEGIETKDQSIRLMSLGYAIGQGFLFSAPVPANDAAHLLGQEKNSRPECEILS